MPIGRAALLALVAAGCGEERTLPFHDWPAPPDLVAVPDLARPRDLAEVPDLDRPSPSGIGDPCADDRSCPAGQRCLVETTGYPGGYCSAECAHAACPTDARCVSIGPDSARCYLACRDDNDCRMPGYLCHDGACVPMSPEEFEGRYPDPGTKNGAACVTPVIAPGKPGGLFAPELRVSSGPFDAECHLAVDPATRRSVVTWIAISSEAIGVARSANGGASFDTPYRLPSDRTVDMNKSRADPAAAADGRGNFYLTWLGFDQLSPRNGDYGNCHVLVARSSDGGASFQLAVASTQGEAAAGVRLDKPWIAVSPVDDSVWVAWNRSPREGAPREIRLARSTDHGLTFGAPLTVSDGLDRPGMARNLPALAVGGDGRGAVVWAEIEERAWGSIRNAIYLQRLRGDGTRDGANVRVSAAPDSPVFDDPSVALLPGRAYVGFVSGDGSGRWDIRVAASLDGGATFLPSVKVNDDPSCATHFRHQIALDARGALHAIWYDNRYLDGNVFHAVAPGAAPGAPLRFGASDFVNSASFSFTTRRDGTDWLGDYIGLAVVGTDLYATWSAPRGGQPSQVYFARGKAR